MIALEQIFDIEVVQVKVNTYRSIDLSPSLNARIINNYSKGLLTEECCLNEDLFREVSSHAISRICGHACQYARESSSPQSTSHRLLALIICLDGRGALFA